MIKTQSEEIEFYCTQHTSDEPIILQELDRFTHLNVLNPQMLSGHLQGSFLRMLCSMIQPKRVLEIGTFTGYTAIYMASILSEDAKLYTIDINTELYEKTKHFIEESGFRNKIISILEDAKTWIPKQNETWDLVFIDADKPGYSAYFDLVIDQVKPGGFIIADNVLWSGKVLDEKKDSSTLIIDKFNKKIQQDVRVENMLLPLRDGLMIMRKL